MSAAFRRARPPARWSRPREQGGRLGRIAEPLLSQSPVVQGAGVAQGVPVGREEAGRPLEHLQGGAVASPAQLAQAAGGEHPALGGPVPQLLRRGQPFGMGGAPLVIMLAAGEERPDRVGELPAELRETGGPGAAHEGHHIGELPFQPVERRLGVVAQVLGDHRSRAERAGQGGVLRIEDLLGRHGGGQVVIGDAPQGRGAVLGGVGLLCLGGGVQAYEVVEAVAVLAGVQQQIPVVEGVQQTGRGVVRGVRRFGAAGQHRGRHRAAEFRPRVQAEQPVEPGRGVGQRLVRQVQGGPYAAVAVEGERVQPAVFLAQGVDHGGDTAAGAGGEPGADQADGQRQARAQFREGVGVVGLGGDPVVGEGVGQQLDRCLRAQRCQGEVVAAFERQAGHPAAAGHQRDVAAAREEGPYLGGGVGIVEEHDDPQVRGQGTVARGPLGDGGRNVLRGHSQTAQKAAQHLGRVRRALRRPGSEVRVELTAGEVRTQGV